MKCYLYIFKDVLLGTLVRTHAEIHDEYPVQPIVCSSLSELKLAIWKNELTRYETVYIGNGFPCEISFPSHRIIMTDDCVIIDRTAEYAHIWVNNGKGELTLV